jgi:hypothetical protein
MFRHSCEHFKFMLLVIWFRVQRRWLPKNGAEVIPQMECLDTITHPSFPPAVGSFIEHGLLRLGRRTLGEHGGAGDPKIWKRMTGSFARSMSRTGHFRIADDRLAK